MALTVSSPQLGISASASLAGTTGPTKLSGSITHSAAKTYVVGTTAGQVGKAYSVDINVNTASATALDLTTLTWPDGSALSFAAISSILITNLSTTTGQNLSIGGGTNAVFAILPFTLDAGTSGNLETLSIIKGAGITVDSTHKILTVAVAAGASVPIRVTLFGR